MKAINEIVLSVLNTLLACSRIYCEKSRYRERNYYTVLVSRLTSTDIDNLKSLLTNDNISSIVIKEKDFLRVSVYLRNSAIKQKARITMKQYIKINNAYVLRKQYCL